MVKRHVKLLAFNLLLICAVLQSCTKTPAQQIIGDWYLISDSTYIEVYISGSQVHRYSDKVGMQRSIDYMMPEDTLQLKEANQIVRKLKVEFPEAEMVKLKSDKSEFLYKRLKVKGVVLSKLFNKDDTYKNDETLLHQFENDFNERYSRLKTQR